MISRPQVNGATSNPKSACSGTFGVPGIILVGAISLLPCANIPSARFATASDSFTGLTAPQTKALAEKAHVYMTADGRISMAGLNRSNIKYFAESVDAAVRGKL